LIAEIVTEKAAELSEEVNPGKFGRSQVEDAAPEVFLPLGSRTGE